jgi:hypothetical protein
MDILDLDKEKRLRVSKASNETSLKDTNRVIGIYREVMGARIPGGSEDVTLDLAIRQLVKNFRRKTEEAKRGTSKL